MTKRKPSAMQRVLLSAAAIVLWTIAGSVRVASADAAVDAARVAQIDALFTQWDNTRSAGCAVAVVQDGAILYSRGYGMADLEHAVPVTPRTVFSLASVSKQFTAASIMLLAEEGRLSLDDRIIEYLPDLPAYARGITVKHLVHHTSGLRDYFQLRSLAGRSEADSLSRAEIHSLLRRQKGLNFRPGERYAYSNTGYELLGEIVERVSGQSLRDFAAQRIFRPLGMRDTQFYDDRTLIVENRAIGHERRADGSLGIFRSSFALVGSGGLLSTVKDLARWDRNFYHNVLGRGGAGLIDLMLATPPLNDGTPNNYGAGLIMRKFRGLPAVRHAGRSFGFRSDMIRFPEQRFSAIVLCNLYDVNTGALVESVADLFLSTLYTQAKQPESIGGGETEPLDTRALSDAKLAAYEGRYHSDELDSDYLVRAQEGGLVIYPMNGNVQRYLALGGDEFVSSVSPMIRARFIRARGRTTGFELDHGALKNLRFERQK